MDSELELVTRFALSHLKHGLIKNERNWMGLFLLEHL